MSYVIAAPESMTAPAADLATIGSSVGAAHMAAAPPTLALAPAAADEVSVTIAHLFSQHAQDYQAVAREAAKFQEQFVQNLKSSAAAYTSVEDAIVSFSKRFEYTTIEDVVAGLLQGLDQVVHSFGAAVEQQLVQFVSVLPQLFNCVIAYAAYGLFLRLLALAALNCAVNLIIAMITGQPL
jgi:hypothetical protein